MNFPWIICLAQSDAASLAGLRLAPDLEVAEADQLIWLRGPSGDESLARRLAGLPAIARYEWIAPDQLRQIDQRIVTARLSPGLRWQPLRSWLRVELPSAAIPAAEPARVPIRLVRSTQEREAELLLTSAEEWRRFAAQAPQVRLERLQFAADLDGRVMVKGTPLPPLSGRRFTVQNGVGVPLGFAWQPAVHAEVLGRLFGVSPGALIVWNEDGTMTRLHSEHFVPATRSAVRATMTALANPA